MDAICLRFEKHIKRMIYIRFNPNFFFFLPLIILISLNFFIHQTDIEVPTPATFQSFSANLHQDASPPEVIIIQPDENSIFQWGARVRYEISVSDAVDGESRYGEINPAEVLLEIKYLPLKKGHSAMKKSGYPVSEEQSGLTLMRKSTCFSCHADKTSLVGPSFSAIAVRYDTEPETVQQLGMHIVEGSSGEWGDFEMPPHENITFEEAEKIVRYILDQGKRKNQWVYPGLDGIFQIIEKPEQYETGLYLLTASYINHTEGKESGAGIRGEHSIVLEIE